jgi:hypothetical protein
MKQIKVTIKNPDFARWYRSYQTYNISKSISLSLNEMRKYYKK